MNKAQYQKYIAKQRMQYEGKPCETCGKQHNHTYGSGRFCSFKCAHCSPNVKRHLDHLREIGCIHGKAVYGTWKCLKCQEIFETKSTLMQHYHEFHHVQTQTIIKKSETEFECAYCHKTFGSKISVMSHMRSCKCHPNKELHDIQHRQDGNKKHEAFQNGRLKSHWLGKKHSQKTKQYMRESTAKYLQTVNSTPCRYNRDSIVVLEQIAKDHGWNIQHAENGGEFYTGIGYFVDAYDKEKNIVLEYDEPKHYVDVENNILRQKDIHRQNEIIQHLKCEFWRYNAFMKKLWKVEIFS